MGSLADVSNRPALSPDDPLMVAPVVGPWYPVAILDSSLLHKWLKGPGITKTLSPSIYTCHFKRLYSLHLPGYTRVMDPTRAGALTRCSGETGQGEPQSPTPTRGGGRRANTH